MPAWFDNPQADYVAAAYAVGLVALVGIGISSWLWSRRTRQAWRKLRK